MKPLGAGFFAVLAITPPVQVCAVDVAQRCNTVAAVAMAEIKATAAEPMSAAALGAAREGAFRGCMASLNTPDPKSAPAPTKDPVTRAAQAPETHADASAAVDGATAKAPATGGLFEFLTREPKRTKGNKRLRQRGKY